MKKIVLIAVAALVSFAANAQEQKFAYVDFSELVQLMPEMDEARTTLEDNSKENEEILKARKEAIEDILINLELGGTKADLDRMIAELGKGE